MWITDETGNYREHAVYESNMMRGTTDNTLCMTATEETGYYWEPLPMIVTDETGYYWEHTMYDSNKRN